MVTLLVDGEIYCMDCGSGILSKNHFESCLKPSGNIDSYGTD